MGRTDAKTEAKVIEMYRNNYTRKDIVTATGVSDSTISKILKRHGIGMRAKQIDIKTEAKVIEMYCNNYTWKDIVAETGVSESSVLAIVKRNGLVGIRLKPKDEQAVIDMYNKGYRVTDIVAEAKVSSPEVYRILKRNGVEPNRVPIISDETVETIISMYNKGCELSLISRKVNKSSHEIMTIISNNNVEKRGPHAGNIKTDDATVTKIIQLYEDGYNLKSIAESVGIRICTVSNILDREGVRKKLSVRKRKITEDVVEKIISMYKSGWSITDISKELLISESTINRLLMTKEIKRDRRKKIDNQLIDKIIELDSKGCSHIEIAAMTNASIGTVMKVLEYKKDK